VAPSAAYNTVGPDLAVEVLSPDQGDDYVEERLGDFRLIGTQEVWFINPERRTVAGYTRVGEGFEAFAQADEGELFSSRLLQGLSFSAQVLWPRRRPGQTR
jgi:Uma2 family endonuclease